MAKNRLTRVVASTGTKTAGFGGPLRRLGCDRPWLERCQRAGHLEARRDLQPARLNVLPADEGVPSVEGCRVRGPRREYRRGRLGRPEQARVHDHARAPDRRRDRGGVRPGQDRTTLGREVDTASLVVAISAVSLVSSGLTGELAGPPTVRELCGNYRPTCAFMSFSANSRTRRTG